MREAHARGVGLYATGQWRQPARAAVRETGLGVVVIGHRRSEQWGLRALCDLLRADGPRRAARPAGLIRPAPCA